MELELEDADTILVDNVLLMLMVRVLDMELKTDEVALDDRLEIMVLMSLFLM
jgi:hypothetical protein